MGILSTSADEIYELIYYTIPVDGMLVHKKINLELKKDIFGNALGVEAYGTYRRGGFWTKKDFTAEEPVQQIIDYLESVFTVPVFGDNHKFFEVKERSLAKIDNIFKERMEPLGAKKIRMVPYGADHGKLTVNEKMKDGDLLGRKA